MLNKHGENWQFQNEAFLESFLKRHLDKLLSLHVLAQQDAICGQYCDLIAISDIGQLAILELKSNEDRYIAQQLTRYFDAFIEEKPFAEKADYKQPIRLITIAPSFHRDSFVDRKYSQLDIEFLTFQIMQVGTTHIFQLKYPDDKKIRPF